MITIRVKSNDCDSDVRRSPEIAAARREEKLAAHSLEGVVSHLQATEVRRQLSMNSSNREKRSSVRRSSIGTILMLGLLIVWPFADTHHAYAQAVYGSIFGTVTDKSGSVVPNATITVTDEAKGTTTTAVANATGAYRIQHLIPDTYTVQ